MKFTVRASTVRYEPSASASVMNASSNFSSSSILNSFINTPMEILIGRPFRYTGSVIVILRLGAWNEHNVIPSELETRDHAFDGFRGRPLGRGSHCRHQE